MSASSSRKRKSQFSFRRGKSRDLSDKTVWSSFVASLPVWIFFVGTLLWLYIADKIHYVTSRTHLVLMSAPSGLLIALIVFWMLYNKPGEKVRIRDKKMAFIGLLIGCTLGISCIALYIDTTCAGGVIRELHSPIVDMTDDAEYGLPSIYCQVDQDTVTFKVQYELWDSLYVGDTVLLRIREGVLGSNFVDDIIPVNDIR
jgi:hypothetical protein